jgi:hypothetical protein
VPLSMDRNGLLNDNKIESIFRQLYLISIFHLEGKEICRLELKINEEFLSGV